MILMLWERETEHQRKQRVGEKLSLKRAEAKGQLVITPETPAEAGGNQEEVQEELRSLKHLMVQQGKVLERILERQDQVPVYVTVPAPPSAQESVPRALPKMDMPVLDENISVCVIDKTGIEVSGGTVGKDQSEGENISDRIRKLRELKKNKKE